jgi:hypothetical protein
VTNFARTELFGADDDNDAVGGGGRFGSSGFTIAEV